MGNNGSGPQETKVAAFELTELDAEGRTFEGYAAFFNNIDAVGDIIHPGAFAKTLAERGNKVKLLWQHDSREPIGRPVELSEDEHGLFIKAIVSDTTRGRDALALLKDGAIGEMSIGYDPIKGGVDFTKFGDDTVRNLREVRLWEVSLVSFPANEEAVVTALKEGEAPEESKVEDGSVDADGKAVSGSTSLPIASREMGWDAGAAKARVRNWAGAEDGPNAKYRQAFFWYDAENADNFGAYKLPFADVVDGSLKAVPRAVFAVAAALQGSRGGVNIPDADKARIRGKVASYYAKMRSAFDDDSIVPPWDKADPSASSGQAADEKEGTEADEGADKATDDLVQETEAKAGRVLSARNANRIGAALASLVEVLTEAGIELPGAGSEDGNEDVAKNDNGAPAETRAAIKDDGQDEGGSDESPQAGPDADVDPPTSSIEALLKSIELELATNNLLEVESNG